MIMLNTSQLEMGRQKALRAYNILDSAPEPSFDDLAMLAAQVCQTFRRQLRLPG